MSSGALSARSSVCVASLLLSLLLLLLLSKEMSSCDISDTPLAYSSVEVLPPPSETTTGSFLVPSEVEGRIGVLCWDPSRARLALRLGLTCRPL